MQELPFNDCPVCGTRGGLHPVSDDWRALTHMIHEQLETPSNAVVEAAIAELEQAIIQTAAEDGIDLDDPKSAIFPKQRDAYRAWIKAVLPVALEAATKAVLKA